MFGSDFMQAMQRTSQRSPALPTLQYIWRPGPRYFTQQMGAQLGPRRLVSCDPVVWQPPAGPEAPFVLVAVDAPCPNCSYPMRIPHRDQETVWSDDGLLTVRRVLQCPGHWAARDEHGHMQGHKRCGWVGVIREGSAHHPNCPAANFSHPAGETPCPCGGIVSPEERDAEQIVLTGR